jgi:hypothetical protein
MGTVVHVLEACAITVILATPHYLYTNLTVGLTVIIQCFGDISHHSTTGNVHRVLTLEYDLLGHVELPIGL